MPASYSTGSSRPRALSTKGLLVGMAWIAAAAFGFSALAEYGTAAGAAAEAPARWPVASTLRTAEGMPTLLLFAHPRCPCTRASISELERLMRYVQGRVHVKVVLLQPEGFSDAWTEGPLQRRAAAVPGVEVVRDLDGDETRRFGSATSGQVLLYDAAGRLRFDGGITPGRGHEGDSAGREALRALLTGEEQDVRATPVFGCPLQGGGLPCTDDLCPGHPR